MATAPDATPDSPPAGTPDAIEQVSTGAEREGHNVEDTASPERLTGDARDASDEL